MKTYEEYPHHLENPRNVRLVKAFRSLNKSERKLLKARAFRIWIQGNKKINLFTYLYYRIKERREIKTIRETLGDLIF